METKEITAALRELMQASDLARAAWIARFGNDDGFNDWFIKQVTGKAEK